MRTFLIGLLLGVVIGAGALWYAQQRYPGAVPPTTTDMKTALEAKLEALELQATKIQKELAETGRVVRRKATALGETMVDVATDTRITTAIKAKLAADRDLSALDISVSTKEGVVTLSGQVGSTELLGKAMLLALETDGVREVIAVLQIAPNRPTRG